MLLGNLYHYAHHMLLDVYPLTRDEYSEKSALRRASYSYLAEIVESGHKVLGDMIELAGERKESSYYRRIVQAESLDLIDGDLANDLVELKSLRNKTVHENPKVNKGLIVYDVLLMITACGFALFEVYAKYLARANGGSGRKISKVTVDRDYLERILLHDIESVPEDLVDDKGNEIVRERNKKIMESELKSKEYARTALQKLSNTAMRFCN